MIKGKQVFFSLTKHTKKIKQNKKKVFKTIVFSQILVNLFY